MNPSEIDWQADLDEIAGQENREQDRYFSIRVLHLESVVDRIEKQFGNMYSRDFSASLQKEPVRHWWTRVENKKEGRK